MGAFVGQCQLWEGAACDVQFYPAAAVRFPSKSLKIMRTRPGKDKSPPSRPSLPSVFQLHVSFKNPSTLQTTTQPIQRSWRSNKLSLRNRNWRLQQLIFSGRPPKLHHHSGAGPSFPN